MKQSQQFLIKPACPSRTVLGSNLVKPNASVMTKSGSFVVDTGLGIPVKSANMFTDISSASFSPRSTTTEEDLSLGLCVDVGLGLSLNSNRKRRLDYLTFEEKLKRKKLKNRVAAQTSRDRKKARMDELEAEVKELQEKNNQLEQDNFNLQIEKQKLAVENQDLREQLSNNTRTIASEKQAVRVGCSPLIIGPAAGKGSASGTRPVRRASSVEDFDFLHSLPDLLADFGESDNSISQLEELAASLLREADEDQQEISLQADNTVVDRCRERLSSNEMVGPSSKYVESCGPSDIMMECDNDPPLNLSCFISGTNPKQSVNNTIDTSFECQNLETGSPLPALVPCDDRVCLEDAVEEVEVITSCEDDGVQLPEILITQCKDEPLSPYCIDSPPMYEDDISDYLLIKQDRPVSDCGYESLDSPFSETSNNGNLSDLWNESFSELFPDLI